MPDENEKNTEEGYQKDVAVAAKTKRGLSSLRNDRSLGRGLPYIKIGRAVLYDPEDIRQFMESHKIYPRNKRASGKGLPKCKEPDCIGGGHAETNL